jgi:FMN phosphatase YigB (HAD superfamily)
MTSRPVLLVDIDNTLYDWPGFYAPALRAMVHALARELNLADEQIYEELKLVFGQHASLEYAFVVQELPAVQALPPDEISRMIKVARGAFNRVRSKRLQPYEGVKETLLWLRQQEVPVVAITNSPLWRAQDRLWQLKLDGLLSGIVAWEGFEPPADDSSTSGFVRQGRENQRSRIPANARWSLPEDACKPSEKHYLVALENLHCLPEDAWAIGDSLAKDLEPAHRVGINTIWARYGSGFDPQHEDSATLLRVTHWDASRIATTYHKDDFQPDRVVERFSEIRDILPLDVLTLF